MPEDQGGLGLTAGTHCHDKCLVLTDAYHKPSLAALLATWMQKVASQKHEYTMHGYAFDTHFTAVGTGILSPLLAPAGCKAAGV